MVCTNTGINSNPIGLSKLVMSMVYCSEFRTLDLCSEEEDTYECVRDECLMNGICHEADTYLTGSQSLSAGVTATRGLTTALVARGSLG
jgi:hypothetical protein